MNEFKRERIEQIGVKACYEAKYAAQLQVEQQSGAERILRVILSTSLFPYVTSLIPLLLVLLAQSHILLAKQVS